MVYECEWCGHRFPSNKNFKFCIGCELKAQEINEQVKEGLKELGGEWEAEVDCLTDDLNFVLTEMFKTLGEIRWGRGQTNIRAVDVLEKALKRQKVTDRYNQSFNEMYEKFWELSTRLETTIVDDQYEKEHSNA